MNIFSSINKKYHPVPAILWGLFIFTLCFLPGTAFPKVQWINLIAPDKIVHAFLFGMWILIFISGSANRSTKKIVFAAIMMLGFGAGIEFFQEYVLTYRSGEFLDWVADAVGLVIGIIAILIAKNI